MPSSLALSNDVSSINKNILIITYPSCHLNVVDMDYIINEFSSIYKCDNTCTLNLST